MRFRLNRDVAPREHEGIRKLIASCGANNGITFPAANVVQVQLAPPDDHEGPARGRTGVCIENTLEQIGVSWGKMG